MNFRSTKKHLTRKAPNFVRVFDLDPEVIRSPPAALLGPEAFVQPVSSCTDRPASPVSLAS